MKGNNFIRIFWIFIFTFKISSSFPQSQWPLPNFNAQHKITGTVGEYRSSNRFHKGTDITNGTNYNVYAVENGTAFLGGSGTDLHIRVDNAQRSVYYVHVNAIVTNGASVVQGQLLGTMLDQAAKHLHLQDNSDNFLKNELTPYSDLAPPIINSYGFYKNGIKKHFTTDPFNQQIIVNGISRTLLYHKVDVLFDVYDPGVNTNGTATSNKLAPYNMGYEILDKNGVAISGELYEYFRFDYYPPLFGSTSPTVRTFFGPGTTESVFKFILTSNPFQQPYDRYWNTGFRNNLIESWPNNTNKDARHPGEAKYPDDLYQIKVSARDIDFDASFNLVSQTANILIDNFRPYVNKVKIVVGTTDVYSAFWSWNGSQLVFFPATANLDGSQNAVIKAYTTEPMNQVSITIPGIISNTNMIAVANTNGRQWKYTLSATSINNAAAGSYQILLNGSDYASNSIETNPPNIPIHQADGSWLPIPNPGIDSYHGFSIGIANCPLVQIQWQNTIGGNDFEFLESIEQTSDGGYILGGYSWSNISGDKTENSLGMYDYWIVKLDVSGNIQWQNTIGGNNNDELFSITQTPDGGYVCAGWSISDISGDKTEDNMLQSSDYWIVKLNSLGIIQWQNTIGGNADDYLQSLALTADGGYICGGYSRSNISGDKTENSLGSEDYWVVKLDAFGNVQWDNTIGGSSYDYLYSIEQTSDGGYILGGQSSSNISGDKTENGMGEPDYWVVKLDASGNIQWQNTIGGSNGDRLVSIMQTFDGGYILGGVSNSNISGDKTENSLGVRDYWIIKLNNVGNIIWQNTIGGNDDDWFRSVRQKNDGSYIVGGYSFSNISGDKNENCIGAADYWVLNLDASGNIQWQHTIGGSNYDNLFCIDETNDGGYILGGVSNSNISGDKTENCVGQNDYWVVKLECDNIPRLNFSLISQFSDLNVFPNPNNGVFSLSYSLSNNNFGNLEIYNINGQKIYEEKLFSSNASQIIKLPDVANGLYNCVITSGNERINRKIAVIKQ